MPFAFVLQGVFGSLDNILKFILPGCRIPVVRMLWEHVDWVRFPAARIKNLYWLL